MIIDVILEPLEYSFDIEIENLQQEFDVEIVKETE